MKGPWRCIVIWTQSVERTTIMMDINIWMRRYGFVNFLKLSPRDCFGPRKFSRLFEPLDFEESGRKGLFKLLLD